MRAKWFSAVMMQQVRGQVSGHYTDDARSTPAGVNRNVLSSILPWEQVAPGVKTRGATCTHGNVIILHLRCGWCCGMAVAGVPRPAGAPTPPNDTIADTADTNDFESPSRAITRAVTKLGGLERIARGMS